jgi:hypothetical protein
MSSVEYQLLTRIQNMRTRVLDIKRRVGLAQTTPLLDRAQNIVSQRMAGGGMLARARQPILAPPAAPAPAPAPAQTQIVQTQVMPPEQMGIEVR